MISTRKLKIRIRISYLSGCHRKWGDRCSCCCMRTQLQQVIQRRARWQLQYSDNQKRYDSIKQTRSYDPALLTWEHYPIKSNNFELITYPMPISNYTHVQISAAQSYLYSQHKDSALEFCRPGWWKMDLAPQQIHKQLKNSPVLRHAKWFTTQLTNNLLKHDDDGDDLL